MARLSILIPCLMDQKQLEGTLESVLTSRPADVDVIVVDRTGYEDPYGLDGEEISLVPQAKRASWISMLQAGIERCNSDVIHIVGSGLRATPDWVEAPLTWFNDQAIVAVAPILQTTSSELEPDDSIDYRVGIRAGRNGQRVEVELSSDALGREVHGQGVQGPLWNAAFFRREFLDDCLFYQSESTTSIWDLEIAAAISDLDLAFVIEPRSRLLQGSRAERLTGSNVQLGRAAQGMLAQDGQGQGARSWFAMLQDLMIGPLYPSRILQAVGRASERRSPSDFSTPLVERRDGGLADDWAAAPTLSLSQGSSHDEEQDQSYRRAA